MLMRPLSLLLLALLLSGCVSVKQLTPIIGENQKMMAEDGNRFAIEKKEHRIMVGSVHDKDRFYRLRFMVDVKNLGADSVVLDPELITTRLFVKGKPQPHHRFVYEDLVDEQTDFHEADMTTIKFNKIAYALTANPFAVQAQKDAHKRLVKENREILEALKKNLLKKHTLHPGESYRGQVVTQSPGHTDQGILEITIPFDHETYIFKMSMAPR